MSDKKNSFMSWLDRRLPVTENLERHLTKHPVPKKSKFLLHLWRIVNGCIYGSGSNWNMANDVLYEHRGGSFC